MRTRYFGITSLVVLLALASLWYGRYPIAAIALNIPRTLPTAPMESGYFIDTDQTLALSSVSAVTGDVDGDADPDIILNTFYGGRIFLNQGNLTFEVIDQQLGTLGADEAMAAGDFDGDTDLDVVGGGMTGETGIVYVWFNDGAGSFISGTVPLTATNVGGMAVGDVDGDSDLDLFMGRSFGSNTLLWLNDGAGVFADSTQPFGGARDLALGDLDGDDDLDVFMTDNEVSTVWFNQGGAQGGTLGAYLDSGQAFPVLLGNGMDLGDMDRDGDLDAAVADMNGSVQLWMNNGSGVFQSGTTSINTPNNRDVTFSDVDADGDMDLFVARADPNQVWLNQGGIQQGTVGTFTLSDQTFESDFTEGVTLDDLDGDHDPDAVTAHYGSAGRVFRNDGLSALEAYYRLRDDLMNSTAQGQHYIALYNQFSPELIQLILAHPELFDDAYATITEWTPNMEALVTGKGARAIITQAQVDGLDDFLTDASALGSTELQQTIAAERVALPPLDTFVGQTMSQAQVTVLGTPGFSHQAYLPVMVHEGGAGISKPFSANWQGKVCLLLCVLTGQCE